MNLLRSQFFERVWVISSLYAFSVDYIEELIITLTIENCTVDDMGEYTIRITNDSGSASSSAYVTIEFEMPSFRKPLSDLNVQPSETATLECTVAGVPLPRTQWFVSGIELYESDRYHIEQRDDTAILQILNVIIDDTEMSYTCKAVSVIGEATSSANLILQGLSEFVCRWCFIVYCVCSSPIGCALKGGQSLTAASLCPGLLGGIQIKQAHQVY